MLVACRWMFCISRCTRWRFQDGRCFSSCWIRAICAGCEIHVEVENLLLWSRIGHFHLVLGRSSGRHSSRFDFVIHQLYCRGAEAQGSSFFVCFLLSTAHTWTWTLPSLSSNWPYWPAPILNHGLLHYHRAHTCLVRYWAPSICPDSTMKFSWWTCHQAVLNSNHSSSSSSSKQREPSANSLVTHSPGTDGTLDSFYSLLISLFLCRSLFGPLEVEGDSLWAHASWRCLIRRIRERNLWNSPNWNRVVLFCYHSSRYNDDYIGLC